MNSQYQSLLKFKSVDSPFLWTAINLEAVTKGFKVDVQSELGNKFEVNLMMTNVGLMKHISRHISIKSLMFINVTEIEIVFKSNCHGFIYSFDVCVKHNQHTGKWVNHSFAFSFIHNIMFYSTYPLYCSFSSKNVVAYIKKVHSRNTTIHMMLLAITLVLCCCTHPSTQHRLFHSPVIVFKQFAFVVSTSNENIFV